MLKFTPVGIVCVIIYLAAAAVLGNKKRIPRRRQILGLLFFLYSLAVIAITLFPIPIDAQVIHSMQGSGERYNLIPFATICGMLTNLNHTYAVLNLIGNVLLFAPLGFLLPLLFRKIDRFSIVIASGFAATLAVELSQLTISCILRYTYRSFDIDDLILNTLGTIIGFIALRVLQRIWRRFSYFHSPRTLLVIGCVVLSFALASLGGYEYYTHLTPEKALANYDPNVPRSLDNVKFANGVVLITVTEPSKFKEPGYVAWYMKRQPVLGWRLSAQSEDAQNQTNAVMSADGQTFIWGVYAKSENRKDTFSYNGRTYPKHTDSHGFWYVIAPSR